MKKYVEARDLPENEKVYLKKDVFGWRTIQPAKVDGKIVWGNVLFGGKRNLLYLFILLIIAGFFYVGISELVGTYKTIADNPCSYCSDCHEQTREVLKQMSQQNFPEMNFTIIDSWRVDK